MSSAARGDGHDTIVAIATPPGVGAVGLIRVSGPSAWRCVEPLIENAAAWDPTSTPRQLRRVRIHHPETRELIDDALVVFMPGPHSYTGEDVVEVSCHGNPVVLADVVEAIVVHGARLAEPGEFTRRAYLNRRIDLLQAEAVALLIEARSSRAVRLSMRQVEGDLSRVLGDLRWQLLDLIAGLEVALDFPEEGYGASLEGAMATSRRLGERMTELVNGSRRGRSVYEGLSVVIAGSANVGKSSLLNALLGRDRAIVSAEPGTTRDLVEGTLMIEGVEVRLIDGAGIGTPKDELDREGMVRSRQAIADGDLVVVLLDSSRELGVSDEEVLSLTMDRPRLIAASKSDLARVLTRSVDCDCSTFDTGGTAALRERVAEWVKGCTGQDEEGGVVASLRVVESLGVAGAAIERGLAGMTNGIPVEAALVDLRIAYDALDSAVGVSTSEQVLDRIFSRFCVGK